MDNRYFTLTSLEMLKVVGGCLNSLLQTAWECIACILYVCMYHWSSVLWAQSFLFQMV